MNHSRDQKIKLRYNILSVSVYVVGILLLVQLFNLQIVHGEEYREKSNTRLTRESTLEAARGNIRDQSGNKLATSQIGSSLELYKTKIDTDTLNNTLLKITQVLEKNEDTYVDTLPITIEPFAFTINEESQKKWKKNNRYKRRKKCRRMFL